MVCDSDQVLDEASGPAFDQGCWNLTERFDILPSTKFFYPSESCSLISFCPITFLLRVLKPMNSSNMVLVFYALMYLPTISNIRGNIFVRPLSH